MKPLAIVALLGLAALLAQPCAAQTRVYETASGTATVVNVLISSNSSTQLDSAARILPKRFTAEIFNDSATDTLFCGFSTNVSSITATASVTSANYGRRVGPRTSWTLAVPGAVGIWCMADVANVLAVFSQLH